MATIKYDKENFLEGLRPGICSLVMRRFKEELQKELEGAEERAYKTLAESLPKTIQTYVMRSLETDKSSVKVVVDFKE